MGRGQEKIGLNLLACEYHGRDAEGSRRSPVISAVNRGPRVTPVHIINVLLKKKKESKQAVIVMSENNAQCYSHNKEMKPRTSSSTYRGQHQINPK